MITNILTMRFGERAQRDPAAWYVPGEDPGGWLDEIARWDVPHSSVRVFPVPYSVLDLRPRGALLAPPSAQGVRPSSLAIPYDCLAKQLYLPLEARLDPVVTPAELQALLSTNQIYVWHPTSGLVQFEEGDARSAADLLECDLPQREQWDHAQPGTALAPRLTSILPGELPSAEQTVEFGRDDIGEKQDGLSELPPSPREPAPGWTSSTARATRRTFASVVRWLTGNAPAVSSTPTWIDRVQSWADRQLSSISGELQAARHKEIERLLHLLETNPDRGLKYAIHTAGPGQRGVAPPGGKLVEHGTDFDLNQLGGGGPADVWNLPLDYQHLLITRYRELANRELHLGRHRRAAYIFASLLGDFRSAANALVAGRHWREAAVLFEHRLRQPREAARCLKQGGLWTEAIAYYQRLKEHEEAGDLYQELDQPEQAREEYRRAVESHRATGDRLSAARLLERKLDSLDEAVQELSEGWPDSRQAVQCLQELLRVSAESGRHEIARQRIRGFRDEALPQRHRTALVRLLAELARTFPEPSVGEEAADCTLLLASQLLGDADKSTASQLLSAVQSLAPEDRLLMRDCQRFARQRPTPPPKKELSLVGSRPDFVHSLQLQESVKWCAASVCGPSILVAGKDEDHLVLARCSWSGVDTVCRWRLPPESSACPILMSADSQRADFALLHTVGAAELLAEQILSQSDDCPSELRVGPIRGMSPEVVGAARGSRGVDWLFERQSGVLTWIAMSASGQMVATKALPIPALESSYDEPEFALPLPVHARADKLFVGVGHHLLMFDRLHAQDTIQLSQPIVALTGPGPIHEHVWL